MAGFAPFWDDREFAALPEADDLFANELLCDEDALDVVVPSPSTFRRSLLPPGAPPPPIPPPLPPVLEHAAAAWQPPARRMAGKRSSTRVSPRRAPAPRKRPKSVNFSSVNLSAMAAAATAAAGPAGIDACPPVSANVVAASVAEAPAERRNLRARRTSIARFTFGAGSITRHAESPPPSASASRNWRHSTPAFGFAPFAQSGPQTPSPPKLEPAFPLPCDSPTEDPLTADAPAPPADAELSLDFAAGLDALGLDFAASGAGRGPSPLRDAPSPGQAGLPSLDGAVSDLSDAEADAADGHVSAALASRLHALGVGGSESSSVSSARLRPVGLAASLPAATGAVAAITGAARAYAAALAAPPQAPSRRRAPRQAGIVARQRKPRAAAAVPPPKPRLLASFTRFDEPRLRAEKAGKPRGPSPLQAYLGAHA